MKKTMAIILSLMMLISLAACSTKDENVVEEAVKAENDNVAESSTENGTEDDTVKSLTAAISWLPSNLDPAISWNGWALGRSGVGENLIQIDENANFKNVIAESYERIDDKTMVFQIREGVYFHNGKAVDASAVKSSIERALAMDEREDVKFPMEEIIADGMTLTIKTSKPFATLLNNLADPYYMIIDTDATDEEIQNKPIGTGAFKVVKFTPDVGIELEKHDQHWSGPIGVDVAQTLFIKDATTRAMALQSGEIDVALRLLPKDLALFEGNDDYVVESGPNLRVDLIRPNMNKAYMQDKNFRMALHYGIDTKTYAEKIVGTEMANGPFYSGLPFGGEGEMPYLYNPEKAKALLDEAGIVDTDGDGIREFDGQNLSLVYLAKSTGGDDIANVATALQAQLKEIGVNVELLLLENITDMKNAGAFDLVFDSWTAAPTGDPEYFLRASFLTDGYGNIGWYSDETMDNYIETLAGTMETEERYKVGREATAYVVEDVAAIFLYYKQGSLVYKSNIKGLNRYLSEIYLLDERVTME